MDNKKIICLVVVIGIALSWYMGINNAISETGNYKSYVRAAENYAEEKLYGKAIIEYKTALTYKETMDIRLRIIELYRAAFEMGEITTDGNLVAMILETMSIYKDKAEAYEVACDYFSSVMDYDELTNAIGMAEKNRISSKKIEEIKANVRYLYERAFSTFSQPVNITNGYYLIKDKDAEYSLNLVYDVHAQDQLFVAPYSADGMTVLKALDNKVFIISNDGTRQKYLDENIIASSGMNDGRIACKIGETWAYYNYQGEKMSGDYVYAGRFSYGVAAVQTEAGKWQLINTKFEPLTDVVYEDIKLNSAEECASSNVILAKSNGKYNLLTIKGYNADSPEKVSLEVAKKFSCIDCDLPTDPQINLNYGEVWFAFKDEATQKWGFADCEGKIKIEPKFAEARSFSNGYAAVKDNDVWNFADTAGNTVIITNATDVGYFNPNGYCMLQFDNGYWTYIRMYFWENAS